MSVDQIDQDVLKHEAYASHAPLAARLSIYDHQRPAFDLPGFALERLGPVDGPVLDVGWGTGTFTNRLRAERPGLRVIPVDLSIGMGPEVVGEVDRPPFATGSAGAVLAMHMLYYATDPRAGCCPPDWPGTTVLTWPPAGKPATHPTPS